MSLFLPMGTCLFLVIMMGLLDLGRVYYTFVILEDAAGEGAVYLSIDPNCPQSSPTCPNPNNAAWRIYESSGDIVNFDDPLQTRIFVEYPFDDVNPGVRDIGEEVKVTIERDFDLLTPFVQGIAGGESVTITATASQTIIDN